MSVTKKGFTLIELLIVIGVIGLLASMILVGLSGFRKSGRDARRIADMNQMRIVMERYFAQCSFYPVKATTAAGIPCPDIESALSQFGDNNDSKWSSDFYSELVRSRVLSTGEKFPQDPLATGSAGADNKNPYSYFYRFHVPPVAGQASALKYVLRARLEDGANSVLKDDIDGNLGDAYGGLDCSEDTATGKYYYCIGLAGI